MIDVLSSETVKEYGYNAGAVVAGITASDSLNEALPGYKPNEAMIGCRSVIVFGIPSPEEALLNSAVEYSAIRLEIVQKINNVAINVERAIKQHGYKARAVKGFGGKYVDGKQYGFISLKHAAELAGLGNIGRNKLLTHPAYGNLLWLSAVLTDAELTPDKRVQFLNCDSCNKCVEMCPAHALDDADSFDYKECSRTCLKIVDKKWLFDCYLCRKVCPYRFGQKGQNQ